MPLRDKFSELLSRWTPGQASSPPQPADSPPSNASSDQSSGGNALSPIDTSTAPLKALLHFSESPSSYAEEFYTTNRPRSVRSLIRQTIPRPGLGMRRLHGDEKSMVTKERDVSLLDEQRLFPSYKQSSPGGVTIKPGQTTVKPKKLQSFGSLKPVNTLSGRARDSGPVRAQGKQTYRGNKSTGFGSGTFHSDGITDFHSPERPLKRRRRDSLGAPLGRTISISDDDIMEQAAPETSSIAGSSARRSSVSSQPTGKGKRARKGTEVDEFREVERNMRIPRESPSKKHQRLWVDDDREEQFTENAAKERRLSTSKPTVEPGLGKSRNPRHEVLQSVEIHGLNGTSENSPSKDHSAEPRPSRALDLQESSDELQGEATVRPAPSNLNRGAVQLTNDDSEVEEPPTSSGRQQLSPHDIRPTSFISASPSNKKKPTKKSKHKKNPSAYQTFRITYLRVGGLEQHVPQGETKDLVFDLANDVISYPGRANTQVPVALDRVIKIEQGENASRKMRFGLTRTKGTGDQMDIELLMPEAKRELCALFNKHGVKIVSRDDEYMEKVFTRKNRRLLYQPPEETSPISESVTRKTSPEPVMKPTVPKRMKLSDRLQDEHGNVAGQKHTETASSPPENAIRQEVECTSNTQPAEVTKPSIHDSSLFSPSTRATRSMLRRAPPPTVVCDDEDEADTPQPKSKGKQKRWNKSLIYPRFGKKKAEVDAQDVERLSDNEFLNDNLIGFYIRFLQDHLERCNKEAAKKVYFFNSYFFATLTSSPKGRRAINYEGVQKWTRNVNIFSHDYIVVPINENAHWYVAIICNLPYLPGVSKDTAQDQPPEDDVPSSQPDRKVQEIQETPEPGEVNSAQSGKEEVTRQSLASMNLSDEEGSRGLSSQVPTESGSIEGNSENQTQAQASKGDSKGSGSRSTDTPRKSRKQKKPAGPKHDFRQPIIITFDSLNLARSPTISILRDYLQAEAKSKRDVDIDKTMIKGMRAQEIPLQSNYSDCGLYLLAYLEKFVQDPDWFIWKLLRREMSTEEDWPEVRSGQLRSRLRKFLDRLYDEQAQLTPENASEQEVMADMKPISYLLTSPAIRWYSTPIKHSSERLPEESKGAPNDDPASEKISGGGKEESGPSTPKLPTNVEDLPSAAPEPSALDKPKQSEKVDEIIEVPDSQEPIQIIPASPLRKTTHQKEKEKQAQSDEPEVVDVNPKQQGVARNKDGSAKASEPESSVKQHPFEVEIQVKRTPPPPTSGESGTKKSPRASKRKHKPKAT